MKRNAFRRWGAAAIALAVVAVAATGCSGSDDASDESTGLFNTTDGSVSSEAPRDAYADTDGGAPVAGAPGGEEGSATGGGAQQSLDRKQILTATVQIETGDVSLQFQEAGNIATAAGGTVFSSSFGNDGDRQTASLTLRVPNDRYQEVLVSLRGLGTVKQEQSTGTDVTAEYTDLESRLRNLQATEAQYLTLLTQATNVNDILTVQDRINATRGEIEQVQGRIALLDSQTEFSTVTVYLFPPIAGASGDGNVSNPVEAAERAFETSLDVLVGIATAAVAVIAFSWWLIPVGIVAWIIWRKQRATRASGPAPPAAPPIV